MPLYSIMFGSKVTDENTAVDRNYIIMLDFFFFYYLIYYNVYAIDVRNNI